MKDEKRIVHYAAMLQAVPSKDEALEKPKSTIAQSQCIDRAALWRAKNVVVVGISGKIGAGKSCACESIRAAFPAETVVRNFADRLKEEVALHLGIDVALCYSHDGKNTFLPDYGITLGEFLQQWGTRLRGLHPEIWVLAVQSYIDVCVAQKTDDDAQLIVVIGDCRFLNEVQWIRRVGGTTIRLNGDPAGERARSKRDQSHVSETALDNYTDFDLVIDTDRNDREQTGKLVLHHVAMHYLRGIAE